MTDPDNSYRPRSPDFSGFPGSFQPADVFNQTPYPLNSPQAHRASYDASPFFSSQAQRPPYPPQPFDSTVSDMPRQARPRPTDPSTGWNFAPETSETTSRKTKKTGASHHPSTISGGIEVKTKFPVARIKRIMQADEDVGKVAQVTPIAVSKALELFMISLVTKAAKEAKDRSSKRVTAVHLKQAVVKDEVLDFLADIIAKVPDQAGGGKKHDDDGVDQNDGRKRKGGGRRKKEDMGDF